MGVGVSGLWISSSAGFGPKPCSQGRNTESERGREGEGERGGWGEGERERERAGQTELASTLDGRTKTQALNANPTVDTISKNLQTWTTPEISEACATMPGSALAVESLHLPGARASRLRHRLCAAKDNMTDFFSPVCLTRRYQNVIPQLTMTAERP